jgi:hypothetical protein
VPALPEPSPSTAAAIYALHAAKSAGDAQRLYLGCSSLGRECERALWYGFRGAVPRPVEGRMARLFDTGHREEARVIDELRKIGAQVWDRQPDGRQWSVQAFAGHVRGHLDLVVLGLPEAPTVPHVADVKTSKGDKYRAVVKHGIAKQHPEYFAQGQLYMGLMELDHAAFIFVCKDTDEIHVERFAFDQAVCDSLIEKARRIIFAATPPPKAGETADAFVCKWCDHKGICWGTDVPPAGCRTCAHVTPQTDGAWHCAKHGEVLDTNRQRAGCGEHRVIPILLANFADAVDSDGDSVTYAHRDTGVQFVNGPRPGYSSAEIASCEGKAALGNAEVDALREEFSGVIHA